MKQEQKVLKEMKVKPGTLAALGLKALKRAGIRAREVARANGTSVYFMRKGKIVAEKP